MKRAALGVLFLVLLSTVSDAATVVSVCGTLPQPYVAGTTRQLTIDVNGLVCS